MVGLQRARLLSAQIDAIGPKQTRADMVCDAVVSSREYRATKSAMAPIKTRTRLGK
jgi:hypothetical protein